ncbi:6-bladed beta-propeller [uncultured Bacteroides sp.]|uniref:6-bladed beta-propeller n=1 Tax=uncultured Bacteroides sp. TaxID=162156 RepID=UPI0025DF56C4|nr:6-bladed beta-propeller [uncultured Bacteroides sp.]
MNRFLLFICLFFLVSCNVQSTKETDVSSLNIDFASMQPSLDISSISSSIRYIPLETNDSIIIDEPIQVLIKKGYVYVADNSAVYKFDMEGNVLASLRHRGDAPDDYLSITDIQIDEMENIWILSRNNQSLFNYSWDGTLLKKVELNAWGAKISLLSEGKMLLYIGNEKDKDNSHQLLLVDLNTGTIEGRSLVIDELKANYLHVKSQNNFSQGEETFFYQIFNDTIYTMPNSGVAVPAFRVCLDNKNIPIDFFQHKYRDIMDFYQNLFKENYAYGINFFLKHESQCWLSFFYNKHTYWWIADGNRERASNVVIDDTYLFGYEIGLDGTPFFVQENSVVIPLYPQMIMEYATEHLDMDKQSEIRERINYSGDDQNLVLLQIGME